MSDSSQSEASTRGAVSARLLFWGIVVMGLFVRGFLWLSGRSPLDGDECVMGIMAYHLSRLQEFPLYFYGQHYMGTLEIPFSACLMALMPESLKFSGWPIRVTEAFHFTALCAIHFRLCAMFFGRRVALWSVLFLAIGPFYWTDYSSRLRHVTVMLALGELIALLIIHAMTSETKWKWLLIGILSGIGFWHYQLIIIFFLPTCLIAFRYGSASTWHEVGVKGAAILLSAVGIATAFAALSSGLGSRYLWSLFPAFYYRDIVVFMCLGFLLIASCAWIMRRELTRHSVFYRMALMIAGFLIGYFPAIAYLASLKEELWLPSAVANLTDVPSRLWDLMILEGASLLGVAKTITSFVRDPGPSTLAFPILLACGCAVIVTGEKALRTKSPWERIGMLYFALLAGATLLLNVVVRRGAPIEQPRFLLPVIPALCVMFAFLAETIYLTLTRGREVRSFGQTAIVAIISLSNCALWLPGWNAMPRVAMNIRSGLTQQTLEIVRELERKSVRRVYIQAEKELGFQLTYAARLQIRINEGSYVDRFQKVLPSPPANEVRHYMLRPTKSLREWLAMPDGTPPLKPEDIHMRGGFWAGEYYVFPLPPDAKLTPFNTIIWPTK